jgi:non-homologous end joining protein Ku
VLKGVTVTFGIITTLVDLVPAQQSKATRAKSNVATRNLCPTCEADVPLQSQLWCEHGHGPFSADDARKGVDSPNGVVAVTKDEIIEAKAPTVAERKADLEVFSSSEVEATTMPSGNIFRLRSEPTKTYGLLLALVGNPAHAFVCEMVVKGKTCLYRAIANNRTIVLAELVRPERMLPVEMVDAPVDQRMVDQASALVDAMLVPFVPADWADARAARLKTLQDSVTEPSPTPANADVKAAADDLLAMLEASSAAA